MKEPRRRDEGALAGGWPVGVKVAVSAGLVFHMASVLVAQWAAPPASMVERALARPFLSYYGWLDMGHAYRYYAPEPGPTPIVTARLEFGDGRPEVEIRLPDRSLSPRLRYQRQLNLANHMANDVQEASDHDHEHEPGHPHNDESRGGRWAVSYARHLGRTNPGCVKVRIYSTRHLLPSPDLVIREGVPDIDDERFYEVPVLIGEYACDRL